MMIQQAFDREDARRRGIRDDLTRKELHGMRVFVKKEDGRAVKAESCASSRIHLRACIGCHTLPGRCEDQQLDRL